MTEPPRFDTIRTARLLMRRWTESDREPFAALNGDPETLRFFPATLDRAASDAFAGRIESLFEEQGYGLWALEIPERTSSSDTPGSIRCLLTCQAPAAWRSGGGWLSMPGITATRLRQLRQRSP
jgi:RimJ/RimL family protein N-acetyltransferase